MTIIEDRSICFDEDEAQVIYDLIKLVERDYDLDQEDIDIKKKLKKFLKGR